MKNFLFIITVVLSGCFEGAKIGSGNGTETSPTSPTPALIAPRLFNVSSSRTETTTSLSFQSNEGSTVYLLASETKITDADTIKNTATANQPVLANAIKTYNFTGLDVNKKYYLYAVSKDSDGNLSNIVERLVLSPNDPVEEALRTGKSNNTTVEILKAAVDTETEIALNYCKDTLNFIHPNRFEQVEFPRLRTDIFYLGGTKTIPVHLITKNGKNQVFSLVGERPAGNRYALLGTNLFVFNKEAKDDIYTDINKETSKSTEQIFKWLLKKDINHDILSDNITILVNHNALKGQLEKWLSDNGKTANWNIVTDRSLVDTGVYDLYVGESNEHLLQDYQKVLAKEKPLIFFEDWIHPNDQVLGEFGINWHWYDPGQTTTWTEYTSPDNYCDSSAEEVNLGKAINNIEERNINLVVNDSNCPDKFGTRNCSEAQVTDSVTGENMRDTVTAGIGYLRNTIRSLDNLGKNIFSEEGRRLLKLAILMGDKYRQNIGYKLSIWEGNQADFFKAYLADASVHTMNPNNLYQPDLGSFSQNSAAQNALSTINETVSYAPTVHTEWTATELYLLPGKTATITRTDNTGIAVKLKINFQREATTRMWNSGPIATSEGNYSRPKFLASHVINLVSGKSYEISNPYGGPIYLELSGSNDATPVTLQVNNVAKHPMLKAFDDASIQQFISDVENKSFDFIDIVTPYAQIHMLERSFIKSVNSIDGNESDSYTLEDVKQFINEMNDYMIISNYHYAGYLGTGIPARLASVDQTCSDLGITAECDDVNIHLKPRIQHVNIGVFAACGAGCSGNPFDFGEMLRPTGWGPNHEMGHNLDASRLQIYGGSRSGETSNNIFPYYTSHKIMPILSFKRKSENQHQLIRIILYG